MDIPIFYAVYDEDESIYIGPAIIKNGIPSFTGELVPIKSIPRISRDTRGIAIIVDVKGLTRKNFDDRLLTTMDIPGSDIWYLTQIDSSSDILDGFMGNVSKLLIPYHTSRSTAMLKDAFEMSDECIPTIFVSDGLAMCRDDKKRKLSDIVEEMTNIGFANTIVLDTDGSVKEEEWEDIRARFPSVIPYVGNGTSINTIKSMIFEDIIIDHLY
ncbi:MAG: hypothetical protein M0P07_06910 [Candidatus Methanomethylophilaceae archaeon]|nr:hypothetical protein [Candidatus Methanomethylophilaceae archaeon]